MYVRDEMKHDGRRRKQCYLSITCGQRKMAVLHVLMSSVRLLALVLPSSSLALTCKVGLEDSQGQCEVASADYMRISLQVGLSSVGHSLWNNAVFCSRGG